ncbi:MAG TPA: dihydrofolate reductase family protein [Solirubrobacteraceae bacterium]|jgi:riboflavin biosynthesis pyrimidine reductase|nr:dihydrofolate reductase family protein [Solirubrobacteraceae bacterium]
MSTLPAMEFLQAVPPGPAVAPERLYTGMDLASKAPDGRPYLICNFAASADGKATAGGTSGALGGDGDKRLFRLLRTQVDAVMAGTGTLRVERYGPLVTSEVMLGIRAAEGRAAQPLAVTVSRSGDIPFDIPLFADPSSHVAVFVPPGTAVPDHGARITAHPLPAAGKADGGDGAGSELTAVLATLRRDHDVRSVLCEGGPLLFDALLAEDLADELFLTLSPVLVGGAERGITAGPSLPAPRPMRLTWTLERDDHLFLRYTRERDAP